MKNCFMANLNADLLDLIEDLTDDDWQKMTCVAGRVPHLALPAVDGCALIGEDPGYKCGMCALQTTSKHAAIGRGIQRIYSVERKTFRMLGDRGVMDSLKTVGLTRERFDMQFHKLLELAERKRLTAAMSRMPATAPAPKAVQTPKAVETPNSNPAGRHASLWNEDTRCAVEKARMQNRCAKCEGEIKEAEMAFGVLREGPSSSSLERWMHLRCVDGKLRMRALTEGLRGWGAMEAGQRQEVLRRMSE